MKKLFSVLAALFVLLSLAPPAEAANITGHVYLNTLDGLNDMLVARSVASTSSYPKNVVTPDQISALNPGDPFYDEGMRYVVSVSNYESDATVYDTYLVSTAYVLLSLQDGTTVSAQYRKNNTVSFSTKEFSDTGGFTYEGVPYQWTASVSCYDNFDVKITLTSPNAPDLTPTLDVVRGTVSDVAGQISNGDPITIENGKFVFKDAQQPLTIWNANGTHIASGRGSSQQFASVQVDGTEVPVESRVDQSTGSSLTQYYYTLPTLTDASIVTVTVTNDITVKMMTNAEASSWFTVANSNGSSISPVYNQDENYYGLTFDSTLQPIKVAPTQGYQIDQVVDVNSNSAIGTKNADGSYSLPVLADDAMFGVYMSAATPVDQNMTIPVTFPNGGEQYIHFYDNQKGTSYTVTDGNLVLPTGTELMVNLDFQAPDGVTFSVDITGDGSQSMAYGDVIISGLTQGSALTVNVTVPASTIAVPVVFDGTGAPTANQYVQFQDMTMQTLTLTDNNLNIEPGSRVFVKFSGAPEGYTLDNVTVTGDGSATKSGDMYMLTSLTAASTVTVTLGYTEPAPQPAGVAVQLDIRDNDSNFAFKYADKIIFTDAQGNVLPIEFTQSGRYAVGTLNIPADGQPITITPAPESAEGTTTISYVWCGGQDWSNQASYELSNLTDNSRIEITAKFVSNIVYSQWQIDLPDDAVLPEGITAANFYTLMSVTDKDGNSAEGNTEKRFYFNNTLFPLTFTCTDPHFTIENMQYKNSDWTTGEEVVTWTPVGTQNPTTKVWTIDKLEDMNLYKKIIFTMAYVENPEPAVTELTVPIYFDNGDAMRLAVADKDGNEIEINEDKITFADNVQPLTFTAVNSKTKEYYIAALTANNGGEAVEDATTGAWTVSGLVAGSSLTVNIQVKEAAPVELNVPITVTGLDDLSYLRISNSDYEDVDITEGKLKFMSNLQPLTFYISTSYSSLYSITNLTVEGAGTATHTNNSYTDKWVVEGLTDASSIAVTVEKAPTYLVPVTVVGGSADVLNFQKNGSYAQVQLNKENQLEFTAAELPLKVSIGYQYEKDWKIDNVTTGDAGTATFTENPYGSDYWTLADLTDQSAITITLSQIERNWVTCTVNVEGAPADVIDFDTDSSYGIKIKDGKITFDADELPLTVNLLSAYKKEYNLTNVEVTGAGKAEQVDVWGTQKWQLSELTAESVITVTLAARTDITWLSVPVQVVDGPAEAVYFMQEDYSYVYIKDCMAKFDTAQMPSDVYVDYSYSNDFAIEKVEVTGAGKAAFEPWYDGATEGDWTVDGLTDASTIVITLKNLTGVRTTTPINITCVDGAKPEWLKITTKTDRVVTVEDGKIAYTPDELPLLFVLDTETIDAEVLGPDVNPDYTFTLTVTDGVEEHGVNIPEDNRSVWYRVSDISYNSKIDVTITGPTAVNAIFMGPEAGDVYNMQGIRVLRAGQKADKLAPGIYIMNGRKYVVK